MDNTELERIALSVRRRLITMIYEAGTGHMGGSLSSADLLTLLYFRIMNIDPANPLWPDRDRFILSKGHSVEAYYCVLAKRGYFPVDVLSTYGKFNSMLAGHPVVNVPGVELNSGSLGHGLSVGAGMALAAKMDKKSYRTYVLMGDGEQAEGSVYEASLAASHYRLDNLIAIIDRNRLQISGNTEEVIRIDPIRERWTSLGWQVYECDGHNMNQIAETFQIMQEPDGKPHLLVAHTLKGKGISFMENKALWHHHVPAESEYQSAIRELDEKLAMLS